MPDKDIGTIKLMAKEDIGEFKKGQVFTCHVGEYTPDIDLFYRYRVGHDSAKNEQYFSDSYKDLYFEEVK